MTAAVTAPTTVVVSTPPAETPPVAIGTVVTTLPADSAVTAIGGVEYHTCAGVCYRVAFQGNNRVYVSAKH